MANSSGSLDFQEFVSSLVWGCILFGNCVIRFLFQLFISFVTYTIYQGWGIHLPTHMGFLGGMDRATNGTITTYFANYSTEVIFHVSTLIPNNSQVLYHFQFSFHLNESIQAEKARLIGGNSVSIIWTENPIENYEPDFGKNNKLHLVIHPVFKHTTAK